MLFFRREYFDHRGLRTLGADFGLELDFLVFRQRSEAFALDDRVVNEHVVAAILGGDEAETLGFVKPFHSTGTH